MVVVIIMSLIVSIVDVGSCGDHQVIDCFHCWCWLLWWLSCHWLFPLLMLAVVVIIMSLIVSIVDVGCSVDYHFIDCLHCWYWLLWWLWCHSLFSLLMLVGMAIIMSLIVSIVDVDSIDCCVCGYAIVWHGDVISCCANIFFSYF